MKRSLSLLLTVAGLFGLTIGSAWAWFQVGPSVPGERLRLRPVDPVPGYVFRDVPQAESELQTLALDRSQVVNGSFTGEAAGDVPCHVFLGNWAARSAREMTVVQHTPDICWRAAGAHTAVLGQPARTVIRLAGRDLSFECRVFAFGDSAYELTLWCTLVSGQIYGETARFQPLEPAGGVASKNSRDDLHAAGRQLGSGQFFEAVRQHRPGTGEKQFVRLSTQITGTDWRAAHARLSRFAEQWLRVETDTDPVALRR